MLTQISSGLQELSSDKKTNLSFSAKPDGLKPGGGTSSSKSFLRNKSFEMKKTIREFSTNETFKDHVMMDSKLGSKFDEKSEIEKLQKEVDATRSSLHQTEEQTKYWRRKSLDIMQTMNSQGQKMNRQISELEEQIEELAESGVELKQKLASANTDNAQALDAILKCIQDHEALVAEKALMVTEIQTIKSTQEQHLGNEREDKKKAVMEISKSLRVALEDLHNLLQELASTKAKIKRVREAETERSATESEVAKAAELVKARRRLAQKEEQLTVLNERVEKMVFKCSVLSMTNKELKDQAQSRGFTIDPSPAELFLESSKDLVKLEKLCLNRYRNMLESAKSMGLLNSTGEAMIQDS